MYSSITYYLLAIVWPVGNDKFLFSRYDFSRMIKKKILFVITKANWGGAQKYVFDLAENLSGVGTGASRPPQSRVYFDVVVAYGKPAGKLNTKLKSVKIRTIEIAELKRDINIWQEFRVFISLWQIFRQEKPDIVHLNSSKIGGLGALAGRLAGVEKIIFTAHGWAFNEQRKWFSRKIIKFLSWFTILLSHKTIILSDVELKQVSKWLLTRKKLSRIHNGIKPIDFLERGEAREFLKRIIEKLTDSGCPSIDGHRTSVNFSNNLIIGTIAELHRNKGLEYTIEAINKLKNQNWEQSLVSGTVLGNLSTGGQDLKFVIIGEGEERKNLENLIEKNNLENVIFLLGNIENADQYLKAFDIFILPSVKEGLPFVLLEAGSAGLPIIATKVGGIPEIIDDMKSGILAEPKHPQELANALEKIIHDGDLRKKFGENLQRKIKENFSFKKMFQKTLKIYLEQN